MDWGKELNEDYNLPVPYRVPALLACLLRFCPGAGPGNHTGYQGGLAIHEMILVDETIRKMVVGNAPIEELQKAAIAAGYQSMHYDGLKKVIRGLTYLEEIDRTVPDF